MRSPDSGNAVILPDGAPAAADSSTPRTLERAEEDHHFVPVIVKRNDQALRHPDDVLEKAIEEGVEQLERPLVSLALSSIAAGLILAFTAMAVAVVTLAVADVESAVARRIAVALVYPLGFVVCVMSGTQLFTEHTATAVYPVLDGRSRVTRLLRLWGVVIVGNLIGGFAGAGLLTCADDVVGAASGYVEIGHHLVEFGAGTLLVSAILAGWLMAQGAWLILATPPATSQIVSIYIVTFLIGTGGLHHSIAGSVEMFAAWMNSDAFTIGEVARFIGIALAGNLVGGSLFVALLNYGHIRKTQAAD